MNAKILAATFALTLSASASAAARADDVDVRLAWQEPGYVMEVVIVKARRPAARPSAEIALGAETQAKTKTASETVPVTLAWQQPGYVEEVVVVRASRSEILEATGFPELPALPAPVFLGAPAK